MKFYTTLESLQYNPPSISDPFVVQQEYIDKDNNERRNYIIFDGISEYLKYFEEGRFQTCHEVFINSNFNSNEDIIGHPVFDLDIHSFDLSNNWQKELEEDIITILKIQYQKKEIKDVNFIWMNSENTEKISKHLLIHNIVMHSWRRQMKHLIKGLKELNLGARKSKQIIIDSLDDAIYRSAGSLRLPFNKKLNKNNPILFENIYNLFVDGIVTIHNENLHTFHNCLNLYISDTIITENGKEKIIYNQIERMISSDKIEKSIINFLSIYNTGLEIDNISDDIAHLKRKRTAICPISGKMHDKENAYVYVIGKRILFSCYRGCTINIGEEERRYLDITLYESGKEYEYNKSLQYLLNYTK